MKRIILAFTALGILTACADNNYYKLQGYAQGGQYSVTYKGASLPPQQLKVKVDSILNEIDFTLSGYNKGSLVSRLNRGDSVVLNDIFARVYRESVEMWRETDGAFDPSCGPVFDIWGFGFTSDSLPSPQRIASALKACGMSRLISADEVDELAQGERKITSRELLKDTRNELLPQLNFNAIAQGLTSDLIYEYLYSLGVRDMLVDIGEIRCCGFNPSGEGWKIGIDNPVDGNNTPGADLKGIWDSQGCDCGIVTSGNYRKYYIVDGVKYSHTIDPRTGSPVRHSLLSATVIAPTAAIADALATAFMVMGEEKAKAFLASGPEVQACLISSNGIWKSWE